MTTHECPIDGCDVQCPEYHLMCAVHWRMVPQQLQRRLYAAYRRGAGAGTDEHAAAMAECIHAVENDLADIARRAVNG